MHQPTLPCLTLAGDGFSSDTASVPAALARRVAAPLRASTDSRLQHCTSSASLVLAASTWLRVPEQAAERPIVAASSAKALQKPIFFSHALMVSSITSVMVTWGAILGAHNNISA